MKKLFILFALASVLLCSGCKSKAVQAAEDAIAAIGTVSLESLPAIVEAESLLEGLSDSDRSRVTGTETLAAARASYEKILAVKNKIDTLGSVTLYSEPDIQSAEKMLAALTSAEQAQVENRDALTAARDSFESILAVYRAIEALDGASIENGDEIKAAEKLYNNLSYEEKRAVINRETLFSLRSAYDRLFEKEKQYRAAVRQYEKGAFSEARESFAALSDYGDAADYIRLCEEGLLAADYVAAQALLEAGEYIQAEAAFEALGAYADSGAMVKECTYRRAQALLEAGEREEAKALFLSLGAYSESAERVNACIYAEGQELYAAGQYEEAYAVFGSICGYADTEALLSTDKNLMYLPGRTVLFGSYEQDNDLSNGQEAIEWTVLSNDGEKVLLLSRYALALMPYHYKRTDITWAACTLRKWLNGTFLKTAFSAEEQARIIKTSLTADKNPDYGTGAGSGTRDMVFLLSAAEAALYPDGGSAAACTLTAAAVNGLSVETELCSWWLRTPGRGQSLAAYVGAEGIATAGCAVSADTVAVRPALYLSIG